MENLKMNKILHFQNTTQEMIWKLLIKALKGTFEISCSDKISISEIHDKKGIGKRKVIISYDYFEDGKNEIEQWAEENEKEVKKSIIDEE